MEEEVKLNPFERTIKEYLDKRAENDELFAPYYAKEGKSIQECCKFVISEAKRNGREGYTDDEVYGWAVHYYEEDNLEIDNINAKVVVNHEVVLTEEEKAKLKEEAMNQYRNQQVQEVKQKVRTATRKIDEAQFTLF